MKSEPTVALTASEETLLHIVRKLPPERVSEVIDFAQFIEWQTTTRRKTDTSSKDDTQARIDDDEEWDRLFASPEAQRVMLEMAREALAEAEAGLTVEMAFDED